MNIKRNIIFSLELRKKRGSIISENLPIRMRVMYAGTRVDFSTGHRIDQKKWSAEKQQVRKGCANKINVSSSKINADLIYYNAVIQTLFKEFEVKNLIPTPTQVRAEFEKKIKISGKKVKKTKANSLFLVVFDEYMATIGEVNNWEKSSYKKYNVIKKHIKQFDSKTTFEKIGAEWLAKYVLYLQKKGLQNSTIEKQILDLKSFLRWASKKNYISVSAFEWKPKLKNAQKKIIFLKWNELKKLQNYVIPRRLKHLERVRDIFLFQCFTGLRYSDVFNLKRYDVKKNHIEIVTVKTIDRLIIELNDHSRKILEKYKDMDLANDKALPVISNQKMNVYLKELCKLAKIDEKETITYYKDNKRIDEALPKYALMGTHAGRRTFVCNALALGISPQVVMKWTGHSDYKAMKPYIDIADNIKASAMSKFNKL